MRQLQEAGAAVRRVNDERAGASQLLRRAVSDARRAGWGPTRIADAAGVSRQAVHAALRNEESAE